MTREEETKPRNENAELRRAVNELRREVNELRAENTTLREQLEQVGRELATALEQRRGGTRRYGKAHRTKATEEKGPRKKRAQEQNTSRKRGEPTRIERHVLERCPTCNYQLSGESIDYTREVIELPPPQPVEVIEHQVIKRWCPSCEAWQAPHLDLSGQVMGQGRIGVGIASLVAYLRTTLRLPVRTIQTYLETLHNLHLSVGEIVELTHGVRRQLDAQAEELKAEMQAGAVVHVDETGWREGGQNGYVWAFVTGEPGAVRYFEYNRSRGHHVPQHILSEAFGGCLVSDFYSAYNLIPGQHQRCWVHLLRDLHTLKEEHAEEVDVVQWALGVRQLYDEAENWLEENPQATPEERSAVYVQLFERACAQGQQYALTYEHPCCTLAKRVLRHQDELFQFVLVPGMAADNNLVERSLRPLVVMRKISGGSRSPEGTKTRLTLVSMFYTWAARNLNPFHQCLATLQQSTANAPP